MAKFADRMEKIAEGVPEGYQKIEDGVVTGYKKVENAFVNTFMAKEGETLEEAKARVTAGTEARQAKIKADMEAREAALEMPETLKIQYDIPETVETLNGFTKLDRGNPERLYQAGPGRAGSLRKELRPCHGCG